MGKKKQTVARNEVAQRAGVSPPVVSWVVRGVARKHRISESTIRRVRRVATAMGYEPSIWGSMFKTRRSGLVAFVSTGLTDHATAELIRAVEAAARERGYGVMLFGMPNEEKMGTRRLGAESPGGISRTSPAEKCARVVSPFSDLAEGLILHAPSTALLHRCGSDGLLDRPFCVIGKVEDPRTCPSVDVDDVAGAELAVRHLLETGVTRMGIISDPKNLAYAAERMRGCRRALRGARGVRVSVCHQRPQEEQFATGRRAVALWASSRRMPNGIFATGDVLALGALRELNDRGIRCPQEVKLAGFDGTRLAYLSSPSLTTIRQPFREMGRVAVEMVTDGVDGAQTRKERVVLPPALVAQQSTGHP